MIALPGDPSWSLSSTRLDELRHLAVTSWIADAALPSTQVRPLLASALFRAKLLERWRTDLVEVVVHELIARFASRERADLVREFTFAFPVQVIARLMGLPREDYVRFQQSSIELLSVVYDWDIGMAASARLKEYGPVAAPLGAVESIAATVPEDIRATGRLAIGVNVPHAPNEFKNSSGEIVGFDMDLMNAAAKTLGLVPDYRETAFESIMPSVQGGDFNVGMSSFIDTEERQEAVDFVTYFQAGGRCGRSGPGRRWIPTRRVGCESA